MPAPHRPFTSPTRWPSLDTFELTRPYAAASGAARVAAPGVPDPVASVHRLSGWWMSLCDLWWQRSRGIAAIEAVRDARLARLLRHARAHSPLYRDAYAHLPDAHATLADLPVMDKSSLMARFDDWVTDPAIRRADVDRFLDDRTGVGARFRNRYIVWKSSGTSGTLGIYIQDEAALALYDALIAIQLASRDLASKCASGMFVGGRAALVAAIDDHFASAASWQRTRGAIPGVGARSFSLLEPLQELCAQLDAFAPAYLASYPTMLGLLAEEHRAGRLHVAPQLVWSGGECLGEAQRHALEHEFGCRVVDEYGASECMSIAFGCPHGWLHVNADCVVLEAVDADHRPVPPGQPSHTALLTNLANHVQPVIRYDLGDSIVVKPEACACGNVLPAIRVQGRRDDVITLPKLNGGAVWIVPLAIATIVEEAVGARRFQIVQSAPDRMLLRLDVADKAQRAMWFQRALRALRGWLARQHVGHVRIVLDEHKPRNDPASGKLRQVIVDFSQREHKEAASRGVDSGSIAPR